MPQFLTLVQGEDSSISMPNDVYQKRFEWSFLPIVELSALRTSTRGTESATYSGSNSSECQFHLLQESNFQEQKDDSENFSRYLSAV